MPSELKPDLIRQQGLPYLAHLLRRVSDELVAGVEEWSAAAGLQSPTRTRSTLIALSAHGVLSVTEIAALIRQTHPAVINWARLLSKAGLVVQESDPSDGRRTLIRLTAQGEEEVRRLREADATIAAAYTDLMQEADAKIFESLWRMEEACRRKPMQQRLEDAQKIIAHDLKA